MAGLVLKVINSRGHKEMKRMTGFYGHSRLEVETFEVRVQIGE